MAWVGLPLNLGLLIRNGGDFDRHQLQGANSLHHIRALVDGSDAGEQLGTELEGPGAPFTHRNFLQ